MRLQALDMRDARTGARHDRLGRALASDPGVVRAGLRRQFRHPHGVALAQERLPQGAERGQAARRAAPACDSAWRLHGAPPIEPRGDALTRLCRQDSEGPEPGADRDPERSVVDAAEPHPLVPLCRGGRRVRRVRCRARAAFRRRVRAGVPFCGRHRVRRLRGRPVADVDLVPPRVDHDDQGERRRSDLRAADGGRVRLAVAAMRGRVAAPVRSTRDDKETHMPESVYKVIELVGTSTDSWERAAAAAIKRAAKTLRDLRVAEISLLDIPLQDRTVESYRAKIKVSFKYEGD